MNNSSRYSVPLRNTQEITVYLSSRQTAPQNVPSELQGYVTQETWSVRIPTIVRTAARYSKPTFERIWMGLGLFSLFLLPIVVYQVLLRTSNIREEDDFQKLAEIRGITMAVVVGVILLFYFPIAVWKYYGVQQMNRLVSGWNKFDRTTAGTASFVPTWKVKTPGVFRDSTILSIHLPPSHSPSAFHPNAYLPSYINGPADTDAAYFYPYNKGKPGLPRMSVVGGIPLYLDEKRGFEDSKV